MNCWLEKARSIWDGFQLQRVVGFVQVKKELCCTEWCDMCRSTYMMHGGAVGAGNHSTSSLVSKTWSKRTLVPIRLDKYD